MLRRKTTIVQSIKRMKKGLLLLDEDPVLDFGAVDCYIIKGLKSGRFTFIQFQKAN
jgi:hypothetical protein